MTTLSVIREVCAVIGLKIPTAVFGSTEREHEELSALCNEMAYRISEEHDWNDLKSLAELAGDGVTESFAFPSDYRRMLERGQVFSTLRPNCPLEQIKDFDIWLANVSSGVALTSPQWIKLGGGMTFNPAPVPGETLRYFYIRKQPGFTADSDQFPLNERLLKLGMIWQWKANKGLDYAEDMVNYEAALKIEIDNDVGASAFEAGTPSPRPSLPYAVPKDYMP
jgi:hypothetical protein